MVKLEDIPVDASVTWAEEVLLNDANVAKVATVDNILAVQHDHTASDITDLQALLDEKLDANIPITWATKTKITYDADWLVTSWADAAVADISGLQTALDAKASLSWAIFTGDITVPAEAYSSSRNGSNEAPTKNDVYDKMEVVAGNHWTRLEKSSTTQRTSTTTMTSDPDLTFSMSANTTYNVRAFIMFEAHTAPDIKIWYTAPYPTLCMIHREHIAPTTPTVKTIAIDDFNTVTTITCSTGVYWVLQFNALVQNWSNAGTFAFQWAQNTSDANVTQVLAGSYMEYISF